MGVKSGVTSLFSVKKYSIESTPESGPLIQFVACVAESKLQLSGIVVIVVSQMLQEVPDSDELCRVY